MSIRRWTPRNHLDEIAGLLAQGYVRLQEKRAAIHTSAHHALDNRDHSLDFICQAEPFIGRTPCSEEGGC